MTMSQSNKDPNDIGGSNDGPLSGSFHAGTSSASTTLSNPTDSSTVGEHRPSVEQQQQRKELTKTRSLDRTKDHVYAATTKVVKAIMLLSQSVDKAAASQYLDLVLNVGVELRALLSSVDTLASTFPALALK